MPGKRLSILKRLISAAAALVLIGASAMGAYAHAQGHNHHGHSQVAHAQADQAKPAPDAKHYHGGKTGHAGGIADHASCNDLLCHGGYAIVGVNMPAPPRVSSEPPVRPMWFASGSPPHSFERPPKSLVLA